MQVVEVVRRHLLVGALRGPAALAIGDCARSGARGGSFDHPPFARPPRRDWGGGHRPDRRDGGPRPRPAAYPLGCPPSRPAGPRPPMVGCGPRGRSGGSGQERQGGARRGFWALVAHRGANHIADYTWSCSTGPLALSARAAPEGGTTTVAEPDSRLSRYGRVTPLAQAYADLFSMPGWQVLGLSSN